MVEGVVLTMTGVAGDAAAAALVIDGLFQLF